MSSNRLFAVFMAGTCLPLAQCSESDLGPGIELQTSQEALTAAPGNVVANNSFEVGAGGSLPSSWSGVGVKETGNGTGHAFSSNALLTGATGWRSVDQLLPVVPRTKYRVGAWVMTSADVNTAMVDVRAQSNGTLIGHLQTGPHQSGYRFVATEFDSGGESNAWLLLGMHSPATASWMRVDDINVIPNRIGNGGFEDSSGTSLSAPWSGDSMASVRTSGSFSGSKSVRVANTDAGWHAVNQWAGVRPNTNYTVKLAIKSSAGLSNIHVDARGASDYAVLNGASPAASATWQPVTFNFNSGPSNTSVLIYAGYMGSAGGSFIDVDDVTLFEQDPPPVPTDAFTKHWVGETGFTCQHICYNEAGAYEAYSPRAGGCVGGYNDTGMGASSFGCLSIPPGTPEYRNATCYCRPFPPAFQESNQQSALTVQYTDHLGQLTNTIKNDTRAVGFVGTDHGMPVRTSSGTTLFLFGDAGGTLFSTAGLDPIGRLPSNVSITKWNIPTLAWYEQSTGPRSFKPFDIEMPASFGPNVPLFLGESFTPRDGLEINQRLYVFFLGQHNGSNYSVLAHTDATGSPTSWDPAQMTPDHAVITNRFNIINTVKREGTNELYIFGNRSWSGAELYLAKVDLGSPNNPYNLTERSMWRYYAGLDPSTSLPVFVRGESNAIPIISATGISEVNVSYHPDTSQYVMMYRNPYPNVPRGIVIRTAGAPVGPWSTLQLAMNPDGFPGYGHTMHIPDPNELTADDGLWAHGQYGGIESDYGGEYGAYLVRDWFVSQGGVHHLRFVMSTNRPYEVHVLDAVATQAGSVAPAQFPSGGGTFIVNRNFAAGTDGWQGDGKSRFIVYPTSAGRRLSTHFGQGQPEVGTLWQEFTVGTNTDKLEFTICGGRDATRGINTQRTRVTLIHGNETVRSTSGRHHCNAPHEQVRWFLQEFRGQTVKLTIEDSATSDWGFIDVSEITQGPS